MGTKKFKVETCLMSSDHSPVSVTINSLISNKEKQPILHNQRTDWELFRIKLDETISLDCPLKTATNIDMVGENLTKIIQAAAWFSTPNMKTTHYSEYIPIAIEHKISEKLQLRKQGYNQEHLKILINLMSI